MKWFRYIFKLFCYYLTNSVVRFIGLVSKIGIGKSLYIELRAAQDLGAGSGAYKRGDFGKCYEILKPYLERRDDCCHGGIKYLLALLFFYGKGVTLNKETAMLLFEESASLGWRDAKKYLSDLKKGASE